MDIRFVCLGLLAGGPAAFAAATATVWNLELPRGRTARTTVTVSNRCLAAHGFEVTGDPKAPWLAFPGATTVTVPAGGRVAVEASVDARRLDPGEHSAVVTVRCADCGAEPACTQNRDLFDARLKVLWSDEDLRSFRAEEVFPGEFLAVVEPTFDPKGFRQLEKRLGLDLASSFDLPTIGRRVLLLRASASASPQGVGEVVEGLQKDPSIRLAQPNFLYEVAQRSSDDPYRERQYALDHMGAARVEERATGRRVTVAVLDSLVNGKHPDLDGAVIERADFFARAAALATEGHGTAMAGIIAARAHNGIGIAGVAPGAVLLAVRVCGSPASHAHEVCSSEAVARGLDFSTGRGARVVNMSLAGPFDPLVARLVYRSVEGGAVLVAATGNDGAAVKFPAGYEPVIAVTAIDREDRLYARANRGPRVDIAAPGVDIFTLAAQSFGPTTGTSPAAAHVSGAAALLLQVRPELTPAEVRRLLMETARDLGPPGRDDEFGSGALNVCRAISQLTGDAALCR